jgi:hypothetical protein
VFDDDAARLAGRLASLTDPELRIAFVRNEMLALDPRALCALALHTASRAEAGDPAHRDLWLAIVVALIDPRCARLRAEAARQARSSGMLDVAHVLETTVPEGTGGGRAGPERDASGHEQEAHRVPDFGVGRTLTLGERKSLARRPTRDLLARVMRDPHPDVIRILLGNPRIVEDDVVRLCARRPIPPEVLREVFRNPRWIVRYRVRLALVKNPYTPLDLALSLTAGLTVRDAQEIAEMTGLPVTLREACARIATPPTLH